MEGRKREHLGMLAVALAGLMAVVGSSLLSSGGGVWHAHHGATASDHHHGPTLVLSLKMTTIDTDQRVAGINVTLSGSGGGASDRSGLPLGSSSKSGSSSSKSSAAASTLQLSVGHITASLPWPLPASGAAALAATAPLRELVGQRLTPFDSYALPLSPISAVLRHCDSNNDDNDSSSSSSSSSSDDDSKRASNWEEEHSAADGGLPAGGSASSAHCTRVALPVRLLLDLRSVPGFELSARSTTPHRSSSKRRPAGLLAVGDELVITRATSQRVLRLMSHLLRYAVGGALAARCAGELLSLWLLRRFFGRVRYGL